MDNNRIYLLFRKHVEGHLTSNELEELQEGLKHVDEETFSAWVDTLVDVKDNAEFNKDGVYTILERKMDTLPARKTFGAEWMRSPMVRIAASVFIVLSVAGLIYTLSDRSKHEIKSEHATVEISDVQLSEEAMITMADGKRIAFDTIAGTAVEHKGIQFTRLADGSLAMTQSRRTDYFRRDDQHRLSAPIGVSLRVILPDSSIVWLNSGSSIHVWASYGQEKRAVALDGEAFFDVRHRKEVPFYVTAKGTTIRVLGTQFNVSAYQADKKMLTTLVQGSVDLTASEHRLLLKPGQQAVVEEGTAIRLRTKVDMSEILAWKEGYFRFRNKPISDILHELAKWYPMDEVVVPAGANDRLTGSIKRSKKLTDLLRAIEQVSDLRFVVDERRVVVMK